MADLTLTDAQTQLSATYAALSAVNAGQAYTLGNRSVTRAQSGELRETIVWLEGKIRELEASAAGATSPGVMTASWS